MRGAVVTLRVALERVVAGVASREDELVESMIRRNAAEVPDLGLARDEPVLGAVRASARANLRAGLAVLSDDAAPHGDAVLPVELPVEAVAGGGGGGGRAGPGGGVLARGGGGHG